MSPAAQGRCPTHQNSGRTPETLDPVSPNMEPVTSKPSNNAMASSIRRKNENHSIDNLETELIDLDRCITPKCECQNNIRRKSCTEGRNLYDMLKNEDVHRESIPVKRVSGLYGNTVWAANLKWKCSLEWTKVWNIIRVRAHAIAVVAMLLALATAGSAAPARARPARSTYNDKFVTDYLQKFGYLQAGRPEVQNLVSGAAAEYYEDDFRIAIKTLQEFGGIPVTGEIDEATKELLSKKRCGRPDREIGYEENSTRKKRFAFQGATWKHTNLTWSLSSTRRPAALSAYGTRSVLARALDVWEQASRLTFTEINSDEADIVVSFARGQHGDAYAFDGRGSILAHAFFPGTGHGGDAHFDDDELWLLQPKNEDEEGTSLFAVAAHEFGHSLGLSHSAVKGALMFPWYQGIQPNFVLPADDRNGIQQMYGPKEKRVWGKIPNWTPPKRTPPTTTTTTTTTTRRPHHHHPHHNPNWPHYHPQNPTYPTYYPEKPQRPYIPERPHRNSSEEYPQRPHPRPRPTPPATRPTSYPRYPTTRPEYPTYPRQNPTRPYPNKPAYHPEKPAAKPTPSDKPDTCDTSYDAVALIRGELFIFKNRYHWRIGAHGRYKEYPIEISRMWTALPRDLTHVDAVYERPDKKIAFFVGKELYLFDEVSLVRGYPKPLTDLGLPESLEKLDAAMVWGHNGKTYFYSGTMYWKYDENDGRVEPDYPRDMSMWKGVGYNIDSVFQWRDGKTYFFKGKGFWKFNDLQMRVDHERQYASASFWMGCPEERAGRRAPFRALPAPGSTLRSPAPVPGAAPRSKLLHSFAPLLSTILLLYAKYMPSAY